MTDRKTNPPIRGHHLLHEGVKWLKGIDLSGRVVKGGGCECGAQPPDWPNVSVNATKRWHREHKARDPRSSSITGGVMDERLQKAFAQGFNERQQEKAIEYLESTGIINATTPTARINEFLAAWGITPLPEQESTDVTTNVGKATLVTGPAVTKSGKVLTHEDFESLADEAERGYDVSHLKPGYIGHQTHLTTPSQDNEIVDAEIIEDE